MSRTPLRSYFLFPRGWRSLAEWTAVFLAALLFGLYALPALDHAISWAFPKPTRYQ